MSDELHRPESSERLAVLAVVAAILGGLTVFVYISKFVYVHDSPIVVAPQNQKPEVYERMPFGATKAVAIAIDEVKKREGWSGKPDWVNVEQEEGFEWHVTVRRKPRSDEGARYVDVSAQTGRVLNYSGPTASR